MIIFDMEQNSEEWLDMRRGKITGSKLGDIVVKQGTDRKLGFYELMAERIGLQEESEESAMERGSRLEDEARELFAKESKKKVEQVGFVTRDDNQNIALSPDGLIKVGKIYKEALEIKCLSSARHLQAFFEQKIPGEYEEQVAQYFVVMDELETLHFMFYDPRICVLPWHSIKVKRADIADKIKFYKEYQEKTLAEIDALLGSLTF